MEDTPINWLKVWASVGPLAGILLGFFGQWFQQRTKQKHEDKVRFHQLRVDTYSNFLFMVNKVRANPKQKTDPNLLNQLHRLSGNLFLVASKEVIKQAQYLLRDMKTTFKDTNETESEKSTHRDHFIKFTNAVRKELNTPD